MEELNLEVFLLLVFILLTINTILLFIRGNKFLRLFEKKYPEKFQEMGFEKGFTQSGVDKKAFYRSKSFFSWNYLGLNDPELNRVHRKNFILLLIHYFLLAASGFMILFGWLSKG